MKDKKILVVDDIVEFTEMLGRILETEGFQVSTANGGADGLRIATEEHPDLILLDIEMPDVDGYEVLMKLRERNIPTRVIMITGYRNTPRDVVRFVKAGACDYLLKPVNPASVIDAVKRALAVETTINLHISDTTPIVEELIATTEKLARDKEKLAQQNRMLSNPNHRTHLIMVAARLLCLTAAVGVTILLHSLNVITRGWAFIFPIVLFVLLTLPIERARKLSVKAPKTETNLEMDEYKNPSQLE